VPSLSSLLLRIPDQFKPLAALGIGALILVVLVLLHGLGLHKVLVQFKRADLRLRSERPHLGRARFFFGWAVFQMLSLHVLEISVWGFALVQMGLILRPSDAVYFCANAYTTLGYGVVDLGMHWRIISPIIAICGLFTFAWTTSLLVSMVSSYSRLIEQLEEERAQELDMRAAAFKAEGEVLDREKEEERAELTAAQAQASRTSFFQRRRILRQDELKIRQLRSEAHQEVETIREKERLDECKLGDTTPQNDPEVKK